MSDPNDAPIRLAGETRPRAFLVQPDAAARREDLRARRGRDLEAGDVVWVEGWLLARTEVT